VRRIDMELARALSNVSRQSRISPLLGLIDQFSTGLYGIHSPFWDHNIQFTFVVTVTNIMYTFARIFVITRKLGNIGKKQILQVQGLGTINKRMKKRLFSLFRKCTLLEPCGSQGGNNRICCVKF
jgi:hypothetical protein